MKGGETLSQFQASVRLVSLGSMAHAAQCIMAKAVHLMDRSRGRAGDPASECFPRNLAHPNTAVLATENSRMCTSGAGGWLSRVPASQHEDFIRSQHPHHTRHGGAQLQPQQWREKGPGGLQASLDRTVNSRFMRDPDSKYKLDRD